MEEKWEDIEKNAIEEENAHKIGIICIINYTSIIIIERCFFKYIIF